MRFMPLSVLSLIPVLSLFGQACWGEDVVFLKNGAELGGRVTEVGGNRLELVTPSGARTIQKSDIERVTFDKRRRSETIAETDIVVRADLHELRGDVKLLAGGDMVQVTLLGGSKVVLARKDVRRIVRKGDRVRDGLGFYTLELEGAIQAALGKLETAQGDELHDAEAFLSERGIFAIDKVREELAEKAALDEASDVVGALRRIDYRYRLKETVANDIEDAEPAIYEILAPIPHSQPGPGPEARAESALEQKELLLFVFQRFTEPSVPLATLLAAEPMAEGTVRGWSIEFLRRLQKNVELLKIYRQSLGKTQLATAVALGKNRLLIGIPTLIETLEIEIEEARVFAVEHLREFTGENFRFRPKGAPAVRKEAVAQWWAWWQNHEQEIEEAVGKLLRSGGADSEERELATKLWRQAAVSAREEQPKRAESLLRRAIDVDPNLFPAQLNLAILLYSQLDKPTEAVEVLEQFAARGFGGAAYTDQGWAYLHLGHSKRLIQDYDGAMAAYVECLSRHPENFEALVAVAGLGLAQVEQDDQAGADRTAGLRAVLQNYRQAIELIEKTTDDMVTLRAEDLPLVETLPFDRREYNRAVFDARKRYRRKRIEAVFAAAKVEVRLGERQAAVRRLRSAVEELTLEKRPWRKLEVEMRTFLGLLYEGENQPSLALRQFQTVLRDLNSEQEECRRGIDRLRRRLGN